MNQPQLSTDSQGAFYQPSYNIMCTWTNRNGEFSRLELMSHGTRFEVYVAREDLKSCPLLEQQFLDLLHTEPRSTYGLEEWMLKPLTPIFESTASSLDKSDLGYTLHDFYSRVTLHYTLKAVNGVLVPEPQTYNAKLHGRPGELSKYAKYAHEILDTELYRSCDSFEPSQIRLWSEDPNDTFDDYSKLLVNGVTPCFFKKFRAGKKAAIREINAYLRLEEVKTRELMFVPRFIGLVKAEGSDHSLGFLTSYIGNGIDAYTSVGLHANHPEVTREMKMRWAVQATFTLKLLHEAGIVWGDAKPHNLLLDENNDAWLIDFGGSYSEGFVDKEKAETLEGDIQGMGRILEFLGVTQWPQFLPTAKPKSSRFLPSTELKSPKSLLDHIGDYTTPIAALGVCSAALSFMFFRRR